ncbi:MAG: corrinoid protein [Anaerolineae bacterium]|jgi:corrinoid protein of di/trimethylamine methyltransferase
MAEKDALNELRLAIEQGDEEGARQGAEAWLEGGGDPMKAVEQGLREALRNVGEKFERLEVFLPEMMMAADAGNAVMEVLEPAIAESGQHAESPGTVVIGTAKGDIHTIGKNILAMLLRLAGFEVHDLGEDVAATAFLEEAKKLNADIIAISALMTSTMPGQRDVVSLLRDTGARDTYAVMVGGAPTTQEWADQIGADGYAETASGGVDLAFRLIDRPSLS